MKFCLIFILLALPLTSFAGKWEAPSEDKLGMKLGVAIPNLGIEAQPNKDLGDQVVTYNSNTPGSIFLALAYRNLGLTVSKSFEKSQEEIKYKGKSNSTDYQLRFYGKYASTELFYQKYLGYFIDNTTEIDASYIGSKYKIQRPDLSSEHWGAQVIYNFNPDNYSFGAAYDQFYRQTESGGSWLGLVFIDHHKVHGDEPWVPSNLTAQYPESSDLVNGLTVTGGVGGGYGFTLTAGNFYLSALAALAVGSQNQRFTKVDGTDTSFHEATNKFILRPSLGYNGPENYFGLQAIIDSSGYNFGDDEQLRFNSFEFSLFYGHRFSGHNYSILNWMSSFLD